MSRTTQAGKWLLAAVVPLSALALGAIPPAVLVVVTLLAAVACGLLLLDPSEHELGPSAKWILVAFAVLLGFTVLQAIPLPAGVCRVLAPANADIWDRALGPLREPGPSWHPLSVAPAATHVEILKGTFYGCLLFGALRIAAFDDGKRFLVWIIVVSTSTMAMAALAHQVSDAETIFGVYRPREAYAYRPGHLAPLLNPNHLDAYLGIGACVALGAVFSRSTMPIALSASAAFLCAATSFRHVSRGATAALILGAVTVVLLSVKTRRNLRRRPIELGVLALFIVAALGVIAFELSGTTENLGRQDFSKVATTRQSLQLATSSPLFGFGRGAFETVFPSVRSSTLYMTWTHPEDLLAQWTVEWGFPVSVIAAVMLSYALRPATLFRTRRPVVGAWAAIVATTFHELFDFHLETPGVMALVVLCVALVVAPTPDRSSSSHRALPETTWLPRRPALALALASVVAAILVLTNVSHTLAADRRALSARATDPSFSSEAFRAEVRAALLRHPAEPFVPLMGAVRAQTNRENVVPWVARALERSENFGRAHFVLARSLAPRYPAQARLEYRLAYAYDGALREAVVKEALPLIVDDDTVLELVPEGAEGVELLDSLIESISARLPASAARLNDELERRAPGNVGAVRRRVKSQVLDVVLDAPWCNLQCVDDAFTAANELIKREPDACEPKVLLARLRIKRGDRKNAFDSLEEEVPRVTNRGACQRLVIELAVEQNDNYRVDMLLDRLVKAGCGQAADCVDLYQWAASMEEQRGHWARAVQLYRRLSSIAPERDDVLERIGELSSHDGLRADGLEAYETLQRRHPEDNRWPERIAALKSRSDGRPPLPSLDPAGARGLPSTAPTHRLLAPSLVRP